MLIEFLEAFDKDISAIASKPLKQKLKKLIERIESASSLCEVPNIKKLSGFKSAYRIRLGDYRIGVFIEGNRIQFARIIH